MTHQLDNLGDPVAQLGLWKMRFDQVQKDRHTAYAEIERLRDVLSDLTTRHEENVRQLAQLTEGYMHQRMVELGRYADDQNAHRCKAEADLAAANIRYSALREDFALVKEEGRYQQLRADRAEIELAEANKRIAELEACRPDELRVLEEVCGWDAFDLAVVLGEMDQRKLAERMRKHWLELTAALVKLARRYNEREEAA